MKQYDKGAVKRYRQVWLGLVLWVVCLPATQAATDCNAVTEIPVSECQSLMELYNSTNGPNWKNHTGWNQTNTPCSWFGVICGAGHVAEIRLSDDVDPSIGMKGNGLTGQIPDLNLPKLTSLHLLKNQLSGNIPNFNNLPNLTLLLLDQNQLSGSIPDFSNLSKLEKLFLYLNQLNGNIPNFSNLPSLTVLWLHENQLSGSISNFSNLPNLIELWLRDNQLNGNIPNFSNLPNLIELSLGANQLSGSIPNFSNLPKLKELGLFGNQLSGNIPNFSNLPNLTGLWLHENQLSGSIPNFSNWSKLEGINLSSNQLSGNIPNFTAFSLASLEFALFNNNCGLTAYDAAQESLLNSKDYSWKTRNSNCPGSTISLTITKTGNGTVASVPAGIDCGTTCTANYSANIAVTLTATADTNAVFSSWGGNCQGTTSPLVVTMDTAKNCTATFTPATPPSPVANFTVTPAQGEAPLIVTLDASSSTDCGDMLGWIIGVQWSVNGQTLTGTTATVTLEKAGDYPITVTVTCYSGATDTKTGTITVSQPVATNQPSPTLPLLGQTDNIQFTGGIAVNGQSPQLQALLTVNNPVEVTGNITVDPAHVGKTADIFVYVEAILPPATDALYFMLGEGLKTIAVWDKNPANLIPFQPNVTLNATQPVVMYTGPFVYLGTFKVFFGYRLADGTMVASTTPITIITSNKGEPHFPGLVQLTSTDTDKVTLAWLPATDDNTQPEAITYQVHLSDQPNFTPSSATLQTAVTGQEKTEVTGLATGQTYNVLVVAVDQDGNESMERDYRTATTFADPVIVSQTTQFAEDKNLGLGEATTSDGVQFTYPSGGTPPQVGSVLFANVGEDTCLRKVDAVTSTADGGIVVQTSDAELTEVLEQATIASELTLFDVDKAAARSQHTAGVSVRQSVRSDGSRHSEMRWQDDVLIAEQTNFSSQLRSGNDDKRFKVVPSVSFEPKVAPKFLWKLDPTTNKSVPAGVSLHIKGTLTAGIKAEFNFEEAGSVEKEVPIFKRIYRSTYWINGVPIYLVSTLSLKAVLSANASTKIHANAEATVSARLETGAQLNLDQTWKLSPPTTEFDKSFTVDVSAHGQVVGKVRLIPTLQIAYYPLRVLLVPLAVAVDASIEPILMGEVAADTIGKADLLEQLGFLKTQLTQLDFTLQEETFMGISMTVFRKTFPLLKKTQLGKTRSWVLFSLPQLSVAGGSGKVDEPIALAAKTKDGVNNPFNEGSVQWDVYPPGKATVSGGKTGSFTASEEGTYTVFFSGASRIPSPLGRQFAVGEVSVGKGEEKCADSGETKGFFEFKWTGSSWDVYRGDEYTGVYGSGTGLGELQEGSYTVKPRYSKAFIPFNIIIRRCQTTTVEMGGIFEFKWTGSSWGVYRGDEYTGVSASGTGLGGLQEGSYTVKPSYGKAFIPFNITVTKGQTTTVEMGGILEYQFTSCVNLYRGNELVSGLCGTGRVGLQEGSYTIESPYGNPDDPNNPPPFQPFTVTITKGQTTTVSK